MLPQSSGNKNNNVINKNSVLHLAINRSEPVPTVFDYIEYVCITWFTLEFAIKYIVSPNKIDFFKSILNWIDLIANLWFYIDFVYSSFLLTDNYDIHPAWDMIGNLYDLTINELYTKFKKS